MSEREKFMRWYLQKEESNPAMLRTVFNTETGEWDFTVPEIAAMWAGWQSGFAGQSKIDK